MKIFARAVLPTLAPVVQGRLPFEPQQGKAPRVLQPLGFQVKSPARMNHAGETSNTSDERNI